jgi:predicted phage-related endonuclease
MSREEDLKALEDKIKSLEDRLKNNKNLTSLTNISYKTVINVANGFRRKEDKLKDEAKELKRSINKNCNIHSILMRNEADNHIEATQIFLFSHPSERTVE